MNKVEKLAADFQSWGLTRAHRVRAGVRKYGVDLTLFVDLRGKIG